MIWSSNFRNIQNCRLFNKGITKIVETTIDGAEDLDLGMPMYNLTEYSSNCCDATDSLWFYCKDEETNFNPNTANNNAFKSFEYKAKLLDYIVADGNNPILKYAIIAVPLKYHNNFW